jgi:hypothetical protein
MVSPAYRCSAIIGVPRSVAVACRPVTARPARGGGKWISVSPERLPGWIEGFARRHGPPEVTGDERAVRLTAPDGAVAECQVPFPPLPATVGGVAGALPCDAGGDAGDEVSCDAGGAPIYAGEGDRRGAAGDAAGSVVSSRSLGGPVGALVGHALRDRRVGVLLVRLGGHAAGVFHGDELVVSKVGARYVQGRSAAGGWSQRRFARRRSNQADQAQEAAADVAARVLLPRVTELDAVVFGGDRRAVAALRADRRLAPLFAKENGPFLTVPDPRLAVLKDSPRLFRAVRIRLLEPPP